MRKLLLFISLLVLLIMSGLMFGVKQSKADLYCGVGSKCQSGVQRTATRRIGCKEDSLGVCRDITTPYNGVCSRLPDGGMTCPGGGLCCGFSYPSGTCNYSTCKFTPNTQFYTCCICDDISWSVCTKPCGGGTQISNCGRTRSCNDQSCCSATAPTNLAVTKISSSTWQLIWVKGSGGISQRVYVGTDKSKVESNCPLVGDCVVKDEAVDVNAQSYNVEGLSAGTIYYYRVVTYNSSCSSNSATLTNLSSCDVEPNLTLQVGSTVTLTTQVLSSSEIGSVAYVKSGSSFTINPSAYDNSYIYSTNVTGVSVGTGTITSNVKTGTNGSGTTICTDVSDVTVTSPGPWWQVVDGDVQTNGSLSSDIPTGLFFGLPGLGGFPGVAKYGASTTLSSADVSEKHWLAKSLYSPLNNKIQNYSFFRKLIPEDVVINQVASSSVDGSAFSSGGTESFGYFWYEYDSTVSGLSLSINSPIVLPDGRKVVILVTGANLNIAGSITYSSGKSILVAMVNGDITIDPNVGDSLYDLQGFFLADGNISTGVSSKSLHVKGSVATQGSLVLQRDIESLNGTDASVVFEYDPASAFLFPAKLSVEKTRWKEVAP